MILRNRGLAFKLSLFFFVSSALIFGGIFGYSYMFSKDMIGRNVEEKARALVSTKVGNVETVLCSVRKVPESISYVLENGSYDRKELTSLLRSVVENNPEIYGATIAFEPYAYDRKELYFAPYYYKGGGKLQFAYIGGPSYRYFFKDWYQIPKELGHPEWSEPYYDEAGKILMSTYSVPFYKTANGKRTFMGVVTADVSLEWLRDIVSSIKVLQSGYGVLSSRNGTIVTHPSKKMIMNETIFSIAEDRGDKAMREVGRSMIRGESGFVPFRNIYGKDCWMYYAPITSSGWTLSVLFPKDEYLSDISRMNGVLIPLAFSGILLLSLVVVFIARSITKPLRAMVRATGEIAGGNLDVELPPVRTRDEVRMLADSFGNMKKSLKEYIVKLTDTTASKERIESELRIAHDIQMSILPKIFPAFPDRPEFDIYALIRPAKEVGGDFYDFFFIDEEHFCFVIGDVSGKGVPASLFMAVTKTLIKAVAAKGIGPAEILREVNSELCHENVSCMFVTVFLCILNTRSGEVVFSNGGHNPPLLIRGGAAGDVTFIREAANLIVGVMENTEYGEAGATLKPGDSIFMYTDGVTEAMNGARELFSAERLLDHIRGLDERGRIEDTISGVVDAVGLHASGAPQSDDITVMMITFRGK